MKAGPCITGPLSAAFSFCGSREGLVADHGSNLGVVTTLFLATIGVKYHGSTG